MSAEKGRRLFKKLCSHCHNISEGESHKEDKIFVNYRTILFKILFKILFFYFVLDEKWLLRILKVLYGGQKKRFIFPWYAQFTTEPLKAWSDFSDLISIFFVFNTVYFHFWFLCKSESRRLFFLSNHTPKKWFYVFLCMNEGWIQDLGMLLIILYRVRSDYLRRFPFESFPSAWNNFPVEIKQS